MITNLTNLLNFFRSEEEHSRMSMLFELVSEKKNSTQQQAIYCKNVDTKKSVALASQTALTRTVILLGELQSISFPIYT